MTSSREQQKVEAVVVSHRGLLLDQKIQVLNRYYGACPAKNDSK
jgi:hypothetical protein